MMTLSKIAAVAACGLAACDSNSALHLEVEDGAYLRGSQISALEISEGVTAIRAELFLDDLRIAADDFAPFEFGWDTRAFGDGAHELAARIYLDDGAHAGSAIAIWIDNTPPSLGDLESAAVRQRSFEIPANDNLGVARVELSNRATDEAPLILTSSPYRFTWPWGCGPMTLHIRVVDRAGSAIAVEHPVASVNLGDQDCDGHLSLTAGGRDCDDADATTNPDAFEYPEGIDRNCDGSVATLEGVDLDHDGVASVASGGDDCNDEDPSVHGTFLVLAEEQVSIDGQPIQWSPGDAVLSDSGSLFLNQNGVVRQLRAGPNEAASVVTVASDANTASIAARFGSYGNDNAPAGDYVAYGRGNQVVVARLVEGAWSTHTVINANARVGQLAYVPPYMGAEYVVFQAGTEVWFASSNNGVWTTQLLVDAGAPLAEAPLLTAAPYGADVAFRTSHAAWIANRLGVTSPLTTRALGPAGVALSAIAQRWASVAVVAVDEDSGAALHGAHLDGSLRFPRRITRMFASGGYLYVQLEELGLQILRVHDFRRVQTLPAVTAFDTAIAGKFAGNGRVYRSTASSVRAPADSPGDNIDRNCDGSDY